MLPVLVPRAAKLSTVILSKLVLVHIVVLKLHDFFAGLSTTDADSSNFAQLHRAAPLVVFQEAMRSHRVPICSNLSASVLTLNTASHVCG